MTANPAKIKTSSGTWVDLASTPVDLSTFYTKAEVDTKDTVVSNKIGLVPIIPTSVSVGSGSGSVGVNGAVTFTNATSVSINGCFTSTYDNYRIVSDFLAPSASGNNPWIRLRSAGTDASAGNYYSAGRRIISWGGASSDMLYSALTVYPVVDTNGESNSYRGFTLDIQNPYESTPTGMLMSSYLSGSSYYGAGFYNGLYRANTSFDGISLLHTDSSTGTIRIYGYNNN